MISSGNQLLLTQALLRQEMSISSPFDDYDPDAVYTDL